MRTNSWYDRVLSVSRTANRSTRQREFEELQIELQNAQADLNRSSVLAASLLSRQTRGQLVADLLVVPLLRAAMSAHVLCKSYDDANTQLQLAQLAAALAVHRAEKGAYPARLEELLPATLEVPPIDLFGRPFVYKRHEPGYILYSVGENGIDDRGSNVEAQVFEGSSIEHLDPAEAESLRSKIPPGADDVSIRVPQPAFEMPK
jgi:hypothetical protein